MMKIIDIALKDLVRATRSMFLIGMAVVAPLLLTGLVYFAFGNLAREEVNMTPINVGVVNADVLPEGAQLEAALGDTIRSMFFDESVKSWIIASDYADEAAARAALDAQEIGVAVIIPETFTADFFDEKNKTAIVILQDPTLTIGPTVVRDMVTSLLEGVAGGGVAYKVITERNPTLDPAELPALFEQYSTWYAEFQRAMFHSPSKAALVVRSPETGNAAGTMAQTIMGLVFAGQLIFFSFFTGSYSMMSILQEVEEGTLARMFTTPTNRTVILAGKFFAVFLTVLLQGVVLLTAGRLLFGVDWGEPGSITLALLGQLFASVGLAVLLVSFIKSSKQAGFVFGGALTMLGMMSGLFTTNIAMPAGFAAIGNFTPQGWVLKSWKLSLAGAPANELIVPFLVLVGMGLVMFAVGAMLFRRRFA